MPSETVIFTFDEPIPPCNVNDQFCGSLGTLKSSAAMARAEPWPDNASALLIVLTILVIISKTLFLPAPVSTVSKAVPPSILVATFIDSEI